MSVKALSKKNEDFFEQVFAVVRLIPEGRVTSYGAIANYLASKRASRMVGWAMNASHQHKDVPAHRVVNRNGVLTGKFHFSNIMDMEERLKSEGVVVKQDVVQNFDVIFWDPSFELELI